MASNKKSYDGAHDYKQELKSGYRHSERSETDTCPTKLELMYSYKTDLEHCCAKCINCFDEWDHYSWLAWNYFKEPKIYNRFYCNRLHRYMMPNDVMRCFKHI